MRAVPLYLQHAHTKITTQFPYQLTWFLFSKLQPPGCNWERLGPILDTTQMPGSMQQSSSPVILAFFQEVSYHCYIIQLLSLTLERMALKLISAQLQLVLLHAQRSHIVMYFYFKRRSSKSHPVGKSAKCCCVVFVFLSWLGLTLPECQAWIRYELRLIELLWYFIDPTQLPPVWAAAAQHFPSLGLLLWSTCGHQTS